MKKVLAMLLAAAMVFSLSACAGNMPSPTVKDNRASSVEQPPRQTEATAEPSASPENATNSSITAVYSEVETEAAVEATPEAEAEPQTAIDNEGSPDGIRPEFKDAMDSYEAFYTEYCEFLKSYSENPTDLTLLTQYADMVAKAEEMDEAFEAWDEDDLSSEELKYYLEVNNRVMQMLVDAAG